MRLAVPILISLIVASACTSESGITDEYGRRHESFAEATAHRQAEYDEVYSEIQTLPVPLDNAVLIIVPSRQQIYDVIRSARLGHSEVYLQNNTNYMEVDSRMLPRLVEKRNLFREVEVSQSLQSDTLLDETCLIEFVLDIRGMHIFVTQGTENDGAATFEMQKVELPRSWVGAKDDKTAIWAQLNEIESFLKRSRRSPN